MQILDDLDYPLVDIRSGLNNLFDGGLREDVDNPKELTSKPFRTDLEKGKLLSVRPEDDVRATAHLRIMGNERPYSILVNVYVEQRGDRDWESAGSDRRLAKELKEIIHAYLKKNRNKNTIDQFRAF